MDAYPTSKNNTLLLELTDSGDVIFEAYLDQVRVLWLMLGSL